MYIIGKAHQRTEKQGFDLTRRNAVFVEFFAIAAIAPPIMTKGVHLARAARCQPRQGFDNMDSANDPVYGACFTFKG